MKNKTLLQFAMQVGEVMLTNGAETYRVEDTMCRLLSMANAKIHDAFVTPTGIFASVDGDEQEPFLTIVRRVKTRSINLTKIDAANSLSRKVLSHEISIGDAFVQLKEIENSPGYSKRTHILSTSLAAAFFSVIFKASFSDFIASMVVGFVLGSMITYISKYHITKFLVDFLGGMLVSTLSFLLVRFGLGSHITPIVLGSVMPLVPGMAITNAIRDTIAGELVSGITRGVEAFFIAISIAAGVAVALQIWVNYLGGSIL